MRGGKSLCVLTSDCSCVQTTQLLSMLRLQWVYGFNLNVFCLYKNYSFLVHLSKNRKLQFSFF